MPLSPFAGLTAYQIYPRSFQDSNGDGVGDLKGIIRRLPYLSRLGVDLMWLSPIFTSPMVDNGYDIADFQGVDPLFGTLDDLKELIAKARALNIGVLLDLVVNHCSLQHEWFQRACADPHSPEADFFYIRKFKDGQAPNNLRSNFGGSIWSKLPGHDDLCYCHFYAKEQPCLNWFSPELRRRFYAMVNWWLDQGIAGFRADTVMSIGKDPHFPDFPPDEVGDGLCACGAMNERCQETALHFLQELKAQTYGPRGAFCVGEAYGSLTERLPDLIGPQGAFSSIFEFSARSELTCAPGYYAYRRLSLPRFFTLIKEAHLKAQEIGLVSAVLENHDEPRAVSCWLPDNVPQAAGAKALLTLQLSLPGVPFIYQGQELGLGNTRFNTLTEMPDVQNKAEYERALNHGLSHEEALQVLNQNCRDQGRVPMPWDDSPGGGFSTARPWMKVHQDYKRLNVKAELNDPSSVLQHTLKLTALRRAPELYELFAAGRLEPLELQVPEAFAFRRRAGRRALFCALNLSTQPLDVKAQGSCRLLVVSGRALNCASGLRLYPMSSLLALEELLD